MNLWESHLNLSAIKDAVKRVEGLVHKTPVLTSTSLDRMANGKSIFFKCENLQKTGSFKVRGATNCILKAVAENGQNIPGFVTHSSGNHGQAVAYVACQVAKLPCKVVVPSTTPTVKCQAIRDYGAELVFCERSVQSRKETCQKIADETGMKIVHPYDNFDVLAGQSTIAWEFHEQVKDLDAILVPTSGGGLISGISVATKAINPGCKIIAVEPEGKHLGPSLRAKQRLWPNPPQMLDTIAEGIMTQQLGQITFPIACDLVEPEVITISDGEMVNAMHLVGQRMKLIIEASAGAAVAAALSDQLDQKFPGLKRIGCILCGGNTDLNNLPWISQNK